MCGNLMEIDHETDSVQLAHSATRTFLADAPSDLGSNALTNKTL